MISSETGGLNSDRKSSFSLFLLAMLAFLVLGLGIGWLLMQDRQLTEPVSSKTPTSPSSSPSQVASSALLSQSATSGNSEFISQGERVLLTNSVNLTEKTRGATFFSQNNWKEAITQYQLAIDADPNDPESRIYLNNSKARQGGNPLTMSVVVPITPSANEAKEVLRGVALAQDEFNQSSNSQRLLDVIIVNDDQTGKTPSLADNIINFPNVLGVLGHGVDTASRQAIARYERAGLAVLSPINTNVSSNTNGQTILKTVSLAQQSQEILDTYLKQVSETLVGYAIKQHPSPSVVIFFNSDSPYSQALKNQFLVTLSSRRGTLVKAIDVTIPGFDAESEVERAIQADANIAFLALSKNKVDMAITIAEANKNQSATSLLLMGGDELYSPTTLVTGGAAVDGLVLAVPWSWQPNDPFAKEAAEIWRGRVSWRTATAYDATQALTAAFTQSPNRADVKQLLDQGTIVSGTATEFRIFDKIPLVKVEFGSGGPSGSRYRFEPIQ